MNKESVSRTIWAFLPWIVFLLLLFLIYGLFSNIASRKEQMAAEQAAAVQQTSPLANIVVQEIVPITMENSIELPAVAEAWQDLLVKAEVEGMITRVAVREGDRVVKGQPLAYIDSRDYQNTYDSVKARYNLAKLNFQRLQKLQGQAAVSDAAVDESRATMEELEANLDDAALRLEKTTISAPIAGIINDLPADEGVLMAYGDPVAQILDVARIKVEVAIPEDDVTAVRDLQQCTVTFAALNNMEVIGRKYFLAKQTSSNAMSYPLQLQLDNENFHILPGMFARAKIVKELNRNTIGVPLYAVMQRDEQQFVYVIKDQVAERRDISTGFLQEWRIQVTSGLAPGDKVAIVGHRGLEEGQKVNIVKMVQDPGEVTL